MNFERTVKENMKHIFTNFRSMRYFDWINFILMMSILGLGLLFVYSATYTDHVHYSTFFKKQCVGAIVGLVWYTLCCLVDICHVAQWGFCGYFINIGVLSYTLISGIIGMGAQRWVSLYFFKFQPSEAMKILLPLFFAYYFSQCITLYDHDTVALSWKTFMFPLATLLVSFILILKQPDLGTGLILMFSGLVLCWFIGLSRWFFIMLIMVVLGAGPLLWQGLKPYQQKRVLVLFGYGDAKNERYQIEQSKIAIGSGGLWGKGFLKGTQNKLDFLPEDHSDFIFSVLCEEWGFVGAMVLLTLYMALCMRLLFMTLMLTQFLLQILAVGLLLPIVLSMCINIGMVTGLLPTVGIPLPLCSYGVTNLWITLAAFGMLNNIAMRRYHY